MTDLLWLAAILSGAYGIVIAMQNLIHFLTGGNHAPTS